MSNDPTLLHVDPLHVDPSLMSDDYDINFGLLQDKISSICFVFKHKIFSNYYVLLYKLFFFWIDLTFFK